MDKFEGTIVTILALAAIIGGYFLSSATSFLGFLGAKLPGAIHLTVIMGWVTWWALVLGFGVAGAVEAWISSEEISRQLQGHGVRELSLGALFGFISSSCSYSAIATAKNLFKKGASAAASLASFMFASTNLVIEIGAVMLILLGWQFVVADFLGGIIMIILLALLLTYVVSDTLIEQARQHTKDSPQDATGNISCANCGMDVTDKSYTLEEDGQQTYFCSEGCKDTYQENLQQQPVRDNITSRRGWIQLARTQWKEWDMLWEDILLGFVLAGIIGGFVPKSAWLSLFSKGTNNQLGFVLVTAILGVVIGIITFVCSVGNVPFAAVLWANGLPFGAVLAFIYADLIIPPIIDAYRKYYGSKFALVFSGLIFAVTAVTGVLIHFLFLGIGLIPAHSTATIIEQRIQFNYKAVLNIIFTAVFIILYWLKSQDA